MPGADALSERGPEPHVVPGAAELHRDPQEPGLQPDHQVRPAPSRACGFALSLFIMIATPEAGASGRLSFRDNVVVVARGGR